VAGKFEQISSSAIFFQKIAPLFAMRFFLRKKAPLFAERKEGGKKRAAFYFHKAPRSSKPKVLANCSAAALHVGVFYL